MWRSSGGMERGDKDEVQTCSRAETCQSNSLQEILTLSRLLDVFDEDVMLTKAFPKETKALSNDLNAGV